MQRSELEATREEVNNEINNIRELIHTELYEAVQVIWEESPTCEEAAHQIMLAVRLFKAKLRERNAELVYRNVDSTSATAILAEL